MEGKIKRLKKGPKRKKLLDRNCNQWRNLEMKQSGFILGFDSSSSSRVLTPFNQDPYFSTRHVINHGGIFVEQ
jgi:hypothetical protein